MQTESKVSEMCTHPLITKFRPSTDVGLEKKLKRSKTEL